MTNLFCSADSADTPPVQRKRRILRIGIGQSLPVLSERSYTGPDRKWYWLLARMKGYTFTEIATAFNATQEAVLRAIQPLLRDPNRAMMLSARQAFLVHRHRAKARGIGWHFTFDEWWRVWIDSGKWCERGISGRSYVMARNGDVGPYAAWNVHICTSAQNLRESAQNRKRTKLTEGDVRAIRAAVGIANTALAQRYGVSQPLISEIRSRKLWKHI